MIIGITGTLGGGKGTIVEFLLKKGFSHYSVRDFLTREIMSRGLEVNRDMMVMVGNDLREKHGSGYIVEKLYAEAKSNGGDCVIESIRSVGEVEVLKKIGGSVLLAVDCDVKVRYARISNRSSSTDNVSFEEFVAQENREMFSDDINSQNLRKCIEMSDYVLKNNGSFEELYRQIEDVLENIKLRSDEEEIHSDEEIDGEGDSNDDERGNEEDNDNEEERNRYGEGNDERNDEKDRNGEGGINGYEEINIENERIVEVLSNDVIDVRNDERVGNVQDVEDKFTRPSWDEYFINMLDSVAKRATCDRGRTAAIIVKGKHILVTGYVGSPVGLPHCDDVGHQMKKVIHEDASVSSHCVRTNHAEVNAFCQAAKLGVPLEGATLYCFMSPCFTCAKMIINCGIKRVVCTKRYHQGFESEEVFRLANIEFVILDDAVELYEDQ